MVLKITKLALICIVFPVTLLGQTRSNPENSTLHIGIYYKSLSSLEPWQNPSSFQIQTTAIRVNKTFYFTRGLPHSFPLFALVTGNIIRNKLQLESYDPETGFMVFYSAMKSKTHIIRFQQENRCMKIFGSEKFYTEPFSSTFLPAYHFKSHEDKNEFIFFNKSFCGLAMDNSIVPSSVIRYYLLHRQKKNGIFPHPGFEYKKEMSSSEVRYYLNGNEKGILVDRVYPDIAGNLMVGDAILSINGKSVADFNEENIDLLVKKSILGHKQIKSNVSLGILRNGKKTTISFPLLPFSASKQMIPESTYPRYLIFGGLVFTELSGSYLKELQQKDPKLVFLYEKYHYRKHPIRDRLVILSRVLPDIGNIGYQDMENKILDTWNGAIVTDLHDLKKKISSSSATFSIFSMDGAKKIVLKNSLVPAMNARILSLYKISKLDNLSEPGENKIDTENHPIHLDFGRNPTEMIPSN